MEVVRFSVPWAPGIHKNYAVLELWGEDRNFYDFIVWDLKQRHKQVLSVPKRVRMRTGEYYRDEETGKRLKKEVWEPRAIPKWVERFLLNPYRIDKPLTVAAEREPGDE